MIWVQIDFRRDGEGKVVEAFFNRVPMQGEQIEVEGMFFAIDRVIWTVRLDANENPVGQAAATIEANFLTEGS